MKKLHLLVITALLFACSCSQPKALVYKGIQHFGLKQEGLTTMVSIDINLYNPNHYNMQLKNADVEVFINNTHVGNAHVDGKFLVPKKETFVLPVLLNVDLLHALPNAFELLVKKEIDLKLAGTLKAGRHGIYISIPVDYNGKQVIR